jgi:hypothetical protein
MKFWQRFGKVLVEKKVGNFGAKEEDLRSDLGARVWGGGRRGGELPLNRPKVRWAWAGFWAKTLSGFFAHFYLANNKTFYQTILFKSNGPENKFCFIFEIKKRAR